MISITRIETDIEQKSKISPRITKQVNNYSNLSLSECWVKIKTKLKGETRDNNQHWTYWAWTVKTTEPEKQVFKDNIKILNLLKIKSELFLVIPQINLH